MKSKLVSKNPILRFKEGRKIIKAEKGLGKLWDTITDTDLAYIDNPAAVIGAAGAAGNASATGGSTVILKALPGMQRAISGRIIAPNVFALAAANYPATIIKGLTTGLKILRTIGGMISNDSIETTPAVPNQASPLQLKNLALYIKDVKNGVRNPNADMSIYPTTSFPMLTPKTSFDPAKALKAVKLKDGRMIYKMPDGTWRNDKGLRLKYFVSHEKTPIKKEVPVAGKDTTKSVETLAVTPPQSTVLFTPGTLNNGQFTPTGETTTLFDKTSLIPLFKPKPLETFGPGTFNTNVTYNSGNIRANRGVNYSNVNEYWDYLNNNRDSNDYKLFLNIMRTTDGNLNRDVFDLIMAKYGISGNLGRRDSGRLANLLNDLNLIGTEGSDARNSFIDSYNNHFNLALKETPAFKWTPQGGDWRSNLLKTLSLSYRKKGGTLSSRNPITRFKANFRLGPVTTLKTGGEIPKLLKGYKVKKRDTLFKIALRLTGNGNNYKELAKFNNIKDANVIEVGQVINLPEHLKSLSTTSSTKPSNNKKLKDPQILKRLEFLFKNGYYPKEIPLNIAVDGIMGPETLKAETRAAKNGIYYSNGRYIKSNSWRPSQQKCKKVFNPVTGEYTTECSEYANLELLNFKGGTYYTGVSGDAWTRLSNGDFVENGYNYLDNPNISPKVNLGRIYNNNKTRERLMYNYSQLAADKFKEHFDTKKLDPKEVYMANLYFKGSPNIEKAFTNATGIKGKQKATRGTHTGNVWYDGANWRISHNIHGEEHTENLADVLGSGRLWGVTALSRVRHNKQGGTIEKFQKGKPVTINLEQEMRTPNPNGYSLKNIGITRTGTLKTYGNSDSALISGSLLYINSRLPELANRYNLSYDEARNLLGLVLASEWEESGGGNYNKVTNEGNYKPNSAYVKKHLSPSGNFLRHLANGFMGRETSEGLASVKLGDLLTLPNYSTDTDKELLKLPKNGYLFGGLSTFASMALRYLKLKELVKDKPELIYNEDGSLSRTGSSLVLASHNLGFNNIEKNINNTIKTGKDELSLYLNFYYPRLTMLVVDGHTIAGSKPHVLPEVVVTGRKK